MARIEQSIKINCAPEKAFAFATDFGKAATWQAGILEAKVTSTGPMGVGNVPHARGCHGSDMTGTPASSFGPAVPNPRVFVGTLTLEEFIQTMRTGVRPNGDAFTDAMPWQNASMMTDDDLAALYAYLTAAP